MPVEARQRFLDRPAFVVPIVSCALVILFLGFALGHVFSKKVWLAALFPQWCFWPHAAARHCRLTLHRFEMRSVTSRLKEVP
jgi:hypothetical protein